MSAQAAQLITHRNQTSKNTLRIELLYGYGNVLPAPMINRSKRIRRKVIQNNSLFSTACSVSPLAVIIGGL